MSDWVVLESNGPGLFGACLSGDFIRLREILKVDPDAHAVPGEDGDLPLIVTAEHKHETATRILLRSGAKLNAQNQKNGKTALHGAAAEGATICLNALLEASADTEIVNQYGNSAATLAASNNHEATLRRLLEAGANMEHVNGDGLSPLLMALHCEAEFTIKCLLEFQCDVNAQDPEGNCGLHICLDYPSRDLLTKLLLGRSLPGGIESVIPTPSADPEVRNLLGNTALIYAAHCAHANPLRFLLDAGADTETANLAGFTALLLAAKNSGLSRPEDRLTVVMHLVEMRADMEAKVKASNPAVGEAARQRREEELALHNFDHSAYWAIHLRDESLGQGQPRPGLRSGPLLGDPETSHEWKKCQELMEARPAEMEPVSGPVAEEGFTPLCLATVLQDGACEKVASHLCGAGCNTENTDSVMDRTALMWASVAGTPSMVSTLLRSGCNPDTQNSDGWTALMHAANLGHAEHCKALLQGELVGEQRVVANPVLVDSNGYSALLVAIIRHHLDAVKVLAPHSDLEQLSTGFTPLMWAVNQGTPEIVRALLGAGACAATKDELAGWSSLHHSVAAGKFDETVAILEAQTHQQLELLREQLDSSGKTPLMVSVRFGNDLEARTLIGAGATGSEYHVPAVPIKVARTTDEAESASQGLVTSEVERILTLDTPLSLYRNRLL